MKGVGGASPGEEAGLVVNAECDAAMGVSERLEMTADTEPFLAKSVS